MFVLFWQFHMVRFNTVCLLHSAQRQKSFTSEIYSARNCYLPGFRKFSLSSLMLEDRQACWNNWHFGFLAFPWEKTYARWFLFGIMRNCILTFVLFFPHNTNRNRLQSKILWEKLKRRWVQKVKCSGINTYILMLLIIHSVNVISLSMVNLC